MPSQNHVSSTGELPPGAPGDSNPADSSDVESIFREHNDSLVRFIAAKVGSRQEACEIAQEAYVKILSLHNREAVSFLRAFLFKTAANLATDRLRSRSRRSFIVNSGNLESGVFDFAPDRKLEGEQSVALLSAAIDELPQRCREAFLLYRIEEMTCGQVAERLGLRERMVRRYIARALEYLRTRVNGGES